MSASRATGQAAPPPTTPSEPSLAPIRPELFGYDQARHLLLRAGFGGTDQQIRTLAQWGAKEAVDYLVDYGTIPAEPAPPEGFDSDIMRPLTEDQRRAYRNAQQRGDEDTLAQFRTRRQNAQKNDRQQMRELQHWWLKRMIQTPRPLEEKLTLFWHGHFASSHRKVWPIGRHRRLVDMMSP